VYTSNEDYGKEGCAPEEEKKERDRIWHEALQKKLPCGTVHVYLLAPDGSVFNSMHVAKAADKSSLRTMLEAAIRERGLKAGQPLAPPVPQSIPPAHAQDDLVLHLVARGSGHGSWREFPGENWVILTPKEQAAILQRPDGPVDAEIAAKILTYFYPQTENNRATPQRILESKLEKKLVREENGDVTLRLEGKVRLKHAFYPGRKDDNEVVAPVLGWVEGKRNGAIVSFRMSTDGAKYGKEPINVVVRSEK
jgi:hypothetical protein